MVIMLAKQKVQPSLRNDITNAQFYLFIHFLSHTSPHRGGSETKGMSTVKRH